MVGQEIGRGNAGLIGDILLNTVIEQNLRDVGIEKEALPMLACDAMNQTRLLVNNPRPVDEAAALAIYEAAW